MADDIETTWNPITPDKFLKLRASLPGVVQVTLQRGGWALMVGPEIVAVWRPDMANLRNIVLARVA